MVDIKKNCFEIRSAVRVVSVGCAWASYRSEYKGGQIARGA